MRFKDIAKRMRGFSIELPVIGGGLGAEWEPPAIERDIAQRVITFLEDRRALYRGYDLEVAEYVVQSIIEIRRFLTDVLKDLPNEPGLTQHLRYMRGACREFLDTVHRIGRDRIDMYGGGPRSWEFCTALGELRAIFGIHLGLLAAKYRLGMEGDLAKILPASPDDEPTDSV